MSEGKYPPPFSIRLTFEERARLEQDAGDMPLGAYVRSRVFDERHGRRRTRGKRPVKDHKAMAELLIKLGDSRLSSNLNQLARSANMGTLFVTPETERALIHAAKDIADMRRLLLQGFGLETEK